jgi:hypothetical protein
MVFRRCLGTHVVLAILAALFLHSSRSVAANNAAEERMRKDITFLASDECEGRGVATQGIQLAADYIVQQFRKAGLKPIGPNGNYVQHFNIKGPGRLDSPNSMVLVGPKGEKIELKRGKDFQVMGLSGSGKVTSPVVFIGYGATATGIAYDDYKNVNVAGKVVVVIRRTPRFNDEKHPFDGDLFMHHAALVTKMVKADLHKAAAVLFVNDRDMAKKKDDLMSFGYTAQGSSAGKAPAVHVRRAVVDEMLRSSSKTTLEEIEKAIDGDLKPRSALIKGWTATLEVNVKRQIIPAKNVIGVLEGSGPLAKETIILGAHYDHLGYGGPASLAKDRKKRQIHHGADDNASGTTLLMELARRFGQESRRQGRRLVFIAFSGEESGLLGSEHYCQHPLFPLENTVAMVNFDMVGRLRQDKQAHKDRLEVHGTGTSKQFSALIDRFNKKFDFKVQKLAGGFGPSDHASFYSKKIPVLFFFTGNHADYHKPSDTYDKINVVGMLRVSEMVRAVVADVAATTDRPRYIQVKGHMSRGRGPAGPRLGIMPAGYNDDVPGVLIGAVTENGPADKGGLKEGDRIIELAGKPVKNIQVYMVILATQKRGQPLDVGILRNGKKMVVSVKPQ